MKFYDYPGAPNPRRVKIFAAEKGIELEVVMTDMAKREHKTAEFMKKNPSGKIPVLELDDGTCIGESVAICRYLESVQPEPNLFGLDPVETAVIEMHHRHIELELLSPIGAAWVNGPIVAKMGLVEPIEAARERGELMTKSFYKRLDLALGEHPYIAGARYTVADITAICTIDFATRLVGLRPTDEHKNIWAWHERVTARPAVTE
ncbi:MAG: glutathione S-transferase family protein [Pseudomonadales bacterium]|nr:glutathione S-transferase family protein [Pseudomonadales bacterium]